MRNGEMAKSIMTRDFMTQDHFWDRIKDHFTTKNSNFCLENIVFNVEKLFGLAKYPINVWNQL